MPLKCYVDESSDGLGEHMAVMAGYVSDDESWKEFSTDWNIELANQKKPFYSATNKIFHKSRATRNAEKFYRIIENHAKFALCVTTNIADYRHTINRIEFPKEFQEIEDFQKLKDPLTLMYQAFFELSLHELEPKLNVIEPITYIFDETSKYQDMIIRSFKYMHHSAEQVGISISKLGDFPTFENDKSSPPLQAADLLARLVRNSSIIDGKSDIVEMPWKKNKTIPCLVVHLGEAYFINRMKHSFSNENLQIYSNYKLKDVE